MPDRITPDAPAASAAVICGTAAALNLTQVALPGGPPVSPVPGLGAAVLAALLVFGGARVPRDVLRLFGPVGVVLIGVALATTPEYTDAAVLYMLPIVWTAYFHGSRWTAFVVAWTAGVHAAALLALPGGLTSLDRWLDVTFTVAMVGGVVRFVAARNERLAESLAAEARVDQLTGLLNRRGFDERMTVETVRAMRSGGALAAVCFDLDHFKAVNDAHGHEMGDRVLRCFGEILAQEIRATDVAGRTGGEEFVVLLPDAGADDACGLAERIRAAVLRSDTDPASCCGIVRELDWTVSAGVAGATTPAALATLLGRADDALYAAKAGGRNRVAAAAAAVS